MKPHEAAERIKIAVPTIRNWAAEYREFLSPQAVGGDGRHRDFSDRDMRILFLVKEQKDRSIPAQEIHMGLRQLQGNDWEGLPYVPEQPNMAEVAVIPQSAVAAVLDAERKALLREITFLSEQNKQLQTEVKEGNAEIKDLTRKLAGVETELKFWREGRLKPDQQQS